MVVVVAVVVLNFLLFLKIARRMILLIIAIVLKIIISETVKDFKEKVKMDPFSLDHPKFIGSNPVA